LAGRSAIQRSPDLLVSKLSTRVILFQTGFKVNQSGANHSRFRSDIHIRPAAFAIAKACES
jgi:hypothetical protein